MHNDGTLLAILGRWGSSVVIIVVYRHSIVIIADLPFCVLSPPYIPFWNHAWALSRQTNLLLSVLFDGYDIHPVVDHCYDSHPPVVDMKPKWGCLNHFFCVMQLFSSATTICCQVCFIVSHSHINMVYSVGVVSLKVPIVVFRSFLWFPILFLISPFVGLCLFCVFLVSYPFPSFRLLLLWVFLVSYPFSSFRLLPCSSNCAILLFSSLS